MLYNFGIIAYRCAIGVASLFNEKAALWVKGRKGIVALKFLTGEESLDNFDAFLAKLNSMDLDRYLEIKQESYKRFMVR